MATTSTESTMTHLVEVIRSGGWWAVTVPEIAGVFSQTRRLDQVEANIREAIALMLDVDPDEVGALEIVITPPAAVADVLEGLEASLAAADEAKRAAVSARRQAAELLRDQGLPMRDIGRLIGVSHQRVSQLLAD